MAPGGTPWPVWITGLRSSTQWWARAHYPALSTGDRGVGGGKASSGELMPGRVRLWSRVRLPQKKHQRVCRPDDHGTTTTVNWQQICNHANR